MRAKQTEQERASHRKSVKEHMVASRAKETDLERADLERVSSFCRPGLSTFILCTIINNGLKYHSACTS